MTTLLNKLAKRLCQVAGGIAEQTDDELLQSFVTAQDNAALTELIRRHGPAVMRVCLRVLGNRHDSEDAFQATFLVLARKAGQVDGTRLAGWLYGVAFRSALKARSALARRRSFEEKLRLMAKPDRETGCSDLEPVLDEEINRLAEKYRAPIVLCGLEGMTMKEAAQELGWPVGTLVTRLTQARDKLRRSLARRGVVVAGSTLAAALTPSFTNAAVPPALTASTAEAAITWAACPQAGSVLVSAQTASVARAMLKSMVFARLKPVLTILSLLLILGTGGLLAHSWLAGEPASAAAIVVNRPGSAKQSGKDHVPFQHEDGVSAVAFSRDGTQVASGGLDQTVRIWDRVTGKEIHRLHHPEMLRAVAFAPGGAILASATLSNTVHLWDAATGNQLGKLENQDELPKDAIYTLAFSPDGKTLASGSKLGTVHLWNVAEQREILKIELKWYAAIYALAFSPDGKMLATASRNHGVQLWDVASGAAIRQLGPRQPIFSIAFSPQGLLASCDHDEIQIWNPTTGELVREIPAHCCELAAVAFAPDGKRLATISLDDVVRFWNTADGKETARLEGLFSSKVAARKKRFMPSHALTIAPDGRSIAAVSAEDRAMRVRPLAGADIPSPVVRKGQGGGWNHQ